VTLSGPQPVTVLNCRGLDKLGLKLKQ
jgi:hypothetical protein